MRQKIAFESREAAITLDSAFQEYLVAKAAVGVRDRTLVTDQNHWKAISHHLDLGKTFRDLTQHDLNFVVTSMRRAGLAHNTVSSYARVMKTFLSWCQQQGYWSIFPLNKSSVFCF